MMKRAARAHHWSSILTLAAALVAGLLTSGCVTSLGYVPGYVKQSQPTTGPTYKQVREWAYDVRDGYDSRAHFNRYAGSYGAIVAAAALGAVAGLSIFDPSSSAIKGVPIGATFLGVVAAVFNSEPKAQIYTRGALYASGLINLSDRRLRARKAAIRHPEDYLEKAKKKTDTELDSAKKNLTTLQRQRDVQGGLAAEVTRKANEMQDKDAKTFASDVGKLLQATEDKVTTAESEVKKAEQRVEAATLRGERVRPLQDTDADLAEASCLSDDINILMAKVEGLKEGLDSKGVAQQPAPGASPSTQSTKAPAAPSPSPPVKPATPSPADAKAPTPTLAILDLPVKSNCDDIIDVQAW